MEYLQHISPHVIFLRAHNLNFKLNYLRYDFKSSFCYVILGYTFLDRQNQWGGLTKIDITFDPFDIFWLNLAVICRNELSLGLQNLILRFRFLAEIFAKNRRRSFFWTTL